MSLAWVESTYIVIISLTCTTGSKYERNLPAPILDRKFCLPLIAASSNSCSSPKDGLVRGGSSYGFILSQKPTLDKLTQITSHQIKTFFVFTCIHFVYHQIFHGAQISIALVNRYLYLSVFAHELLLHISGQPECQNSQSAFECDSNRVLPKFAPLPDADGRARLRDSADMHQRIQLFERLSHLFSIQILPTGE